MNRYYVTGPMSGEHHNVASFDRVLDRIARQGDADKTTTSLGILAMLWLDSYQRALTAHEGCEKGHPLYPQLLALRFKALIEADSVIVLDGWQTSGASSAEVQIALSLDMAIYNERGETVNISVRPGDKPETVLEEAQRLVHGDRQKAYKHPIYDYTATGRMWAAILSKHLGTEVADIDPRICCLMMAAMKISREAGVHRRDNNVDLAGYAECAQMVAERQEIA